MTREQARMLRRTWRRGLPPVAAAPAAGSVSPFHPAFELVLNHEAAQAALRGAPFAEICAALPDQQREIGGAR